MPLKGYDQAHLCKCAECSFVFSQSIPKEAELREHYDRYSRNDYLSPITIKRYNELLDQFEKYRKTNKLLDLGCGIGYFLSIAMERGWEVHGTEFTKEAVSICKSKDINMKLGALDPAQYEQESFDIITWFEVIEHINTPNIELQKINQLLRSNGLIYTTTPNFNSLSRRFLKSDYNVITYPEHLCYYQASTLKLAMKSNGFNPLSIYSDGFSVSRMWLSQGTSETNPISQTSQDEKIRRMTEQGIFRLARNMINAMLNLFKLGDSLKCWSVKV